MQLRFRFRPSQNVSFGGGFVWAENEKYGFGRSLLRRHPLPPKHKVQPTDSHLKPSNIPGLYSIEEKQCSTKQGLQQMSSPSPAHLSVYSFYYKSSQSSNCDLTTRANTQNSSSNSPSQMVEDTSATRRGA